MNEEERQRLADLYIVITIYNGIEGTGMDDVITHLEAHIKNEVLSLIPTYTMEPTMEPK